MTTRREGVDESKYKRKDERTSRESQIGEAQLETLLDQSATTARRTRLGLQPRPRPRDRVSSAIHTTLKFYYLSVYLCFYSQRRPVVAPPPTRVPALLRRPFLHHLFAYLSSQGRLNQNVLLCFSCIEWTKRTIHTVEGLNRPPPRVHFIVASPYETRCILGNYRPPYKQRDLTHD